MTNGWNIWLRKKTENGIYRWITFYKTMPYQKIWQIWIHWYNFCMLKFHIANCCFKSMKFLLSTHRCNCEDHGRQGRMLLCSMSSKDESFRSCTLRNLNSSIFWMHSPEGNQSIFGVSFIGCWKHYVGIVLEQYCVLVKCISVGWWQE